MIFLIALLLSCPLARISHRISDNSHTLSPHLVSNQDGPVLHQHCSHPNVSQSEATGERFIQRSGEKYGLARISHQHSSRFGQTVFSDVEEPSEGRVKLTLPRMTLKADGNTDGKRGRIVGEKCGLEITGRDEVISPTEIVQRSVYRAQVPDEWVRIDPVGSLSDTMKPNVTFLIEEKVKVTVHSFPSESLEERIPPQAQIARWQNQHGEGKISPVSRGGFVGFFMETPSLLAWSMQLDFEHYQRVSFLASSRKEEAHFKQVCSDYTIKAVGPPELIEKHRDAIMLFAKSFELIHDLPLSW